MRWSNSSISSAFIALASDIIIWRCTTTANFSLGAAPTRWVGESGVSSSGCSRLERLEPAHQGVVLGVGKLGIVEDVVEMVVTVDLLAQLFGFGARALEIVLGHRRSGRDGSIQRRP